MHNGDGKQAMNAMHETKEGVLLDVEVIPSSRSMEVPAGYDKWRARVIIKLKSKPEGGRANRELVMAFSGKLGIPQAKIKLVKGESNRKKSIFIEGMNINSLVDALFGEYEFKEHGGSKG
ncbi:MAG: DUF167 domain-containing protein [Methermicoccaceae archaeon]